MADFLDTLSTNEGITWAVVGSFFLLVLPIFGFLLALVLMSQILRERRPPANAIAWLIAIVLVPYLGVPLYLILGKRKMTPAKRQKPTLRESRPASPEASRMDEILLPYIASGVYPSTTGNRVCLLTDGIDAFHAIFEHLERAERCIHVATYILTDDKTGRAFVDTLCRKLKQGVSVHLLLDAYGCMALPAHVLAPLRDAGGKVAFFMPFFRFPFRGRSNWRNHRKIILIDERIAIVGGMNIAEEYMGAEALDSRWYDLAVVLEGPAVTDFHEIFRADWKFAANEDLPEASTVPVPILDGQETVAQVIASGPDVEGDPLHEAILTAIYGARERVWILTPYFLPDISLVKAIATAAHRGIDVRLLTPEHSNHRIADIARGSYLRQLEASGVRIHRFYGGMLHAKAVIVDSRLSIVGSANLDMRSMFLNYEIALCVCSSELVDEIAAWATSLMKKSKDGPLKWNTAQELLGGVGRLIAPLL